MEQSLVPILVVVATIQVRPLKTEVEKGSAWTAIGRGLVAPKRNPNQIESHNVFTTLSKRERESS